MNLLVKQQRFAPQGTWVSMGVCSDGSYGVPEGLFYSFPVTCEKGEWSIVQGEWFLVLQGSKLIAYLDGMTTIWVFDTICLRFRSSD
jgi:malate dehydrogenase